MKTTIIRIILSIGLLYGVYTETGIWTTLAMGLVFLSSEVAAVAVSRLSKILQS